MVGGIKQVVDLKAKFLQFMLEPLLSPAIDKNVKRMKGFTEMRTL